MTPEEFISDKTGQEYNDHTPLIIDHKRLKRWLEEYAQQQNQWARVEDRLPEPMACPACGAEEPMIGRLDSEYMACDACNTKWRKPDYPK